MSIPMRRPLALCPCLRVDGSAPPKHGEVASVGFQARSEAPAYNRTRASQNSTAGSPRPFACDAEIKNKRRRVVPCSSLLVLGLKCFGIFVSLFGERVVYLAHLSILLFFMDNAYLVLLLKGFCEHPRWRTLGQR